MSPNLLLTSKEAARTPPLYSQEETPDPTVYIRWHCPANGWAWLCTEASAVMRADGVYRPCREVQDWEAVETVVCFGLVFGFETEYGYWSLAEFAEVGAVERDELFVPCPMSECRAIEVLKW